MQLNFMAKTSPSVPLRREEGSSLLEVLITILIMSFGLLGVAGLTTASLRSVKLSQYQSVALQLVNDYAERMRGNIDPVTGVLSINYQLTDGYSDTTSTVTVPTCAVVTNCTSDEMASMDKAQWINTLRRRLPGGGAYVEQNGLTADIWILWQEPDLQVDASSNLSVAATGGSQCPAAALSGYSGTIVPVCMYYRVSI